MMALAFGSLIAANAPDHESIKKVTPIPVRLMPPGGHVMLLKARAVGTQIYVCKAKADDPDRFEWVLMAPDADLFDERGRRIGRRFAGPTWEAFEDGSRVIGTLIEKVPAPRGGDIPWLLLRRKAGVSKGWPSPGDRDDLWTAIDADDRSGCADQLGGEHRDIAAAAAEVEDPHARADPRAPQEALGDRPQDGRLAHQPPDLSPRMSEDALRLRHGTRSISHGAPSWSSTPLAARCRRRRAGPPHWPSLRRDHADPPRSWAMVRGSLSDFLAGLAAV
jgi:hypothetical protein